MPNLSIDAVLVDHNLPDEVTKVSMYCTKWATNDKICAAYRTLLLQPLEFIDRVRSLVGVTRFFGRGFIKGRTGTSCPPFILAHRFLPDMDQISPFVN